MLRELMTIFRPGNPLKEMGENFATMLRLAGEMVVTAGDIYFRSAVDPEERGRIYSKDVSVNKLERTIRKKVVAHLSVAGNTLDLPYCLLLMSLVKDVERLGDYAKNLTEVVDIYPGELPDDEIVAELSIIRKSAEQAFQIGSRVFHDSDRETALTLIRELRDVSRRCEGLVSRIARSEYDAGRTTALVLGVRYYKRIGGHVLNLLTSVVMPLHKVDYYDEDELPKDRD